MHCFINCIKFFILLYVCICIFIYTYILIYIYKQIRRLTRSPDKYRQEIKDVLNAIFLKLGTINNSIQQMIDDRLIDKRRKDEEQQTITTCINKIQENISVVMNKSNKADRERKILKQRHSILGTWTKQLNKRKKLYWQRHNCENTFVIYETLLNKERKVKPRKFLMKFIKNKDTENKRIRKNSVFNQFQSEINLLKIRADHHSTQCKDIDREMLNFFENHYQVDILSKLKRLWGEECKSEETRSQQKCLEKYEDEINNDEYIKPRKEK